MADPTTNLTDEERQRLLASTSQSIIPSLHSIPPLPHAEEAKLMGGGTITPAARTGMIPPTAGAMGITPGTPQYGEQNQTRLDYEKQFPWGTPQNHPGTWGKIGHVLGTIGNVAGQFAPSIAEAIPGSFQNRQMQERQNAKWINLGGENELRGAQTAKAQADVPLEQAQTKNLESEAAARPELTQSEIAEHNAHAASLLHPQAKTDFEAWQQQNPGKPIEEWLKAKKEDKPDTANQDRERYETIIQNQRLGRPVTPEDAAWSKAYEKAGTLTPFATAVAQAPQRADARSDRSYQMQVGRLDKMRTPLAQIQNRIANLSESVNQNTPQADALVAPELLSIMAGGQASGLRMNEAEISRIVGGRSNWESLKAAANKWSLDPKSALSITPEQRQEIRALYQAVNHRIGEQLKSLDAAEEKLNNTDDPTEMRKIMSDTNQQFTGAAQAEIGAAGQSGTTGGSITVQAGGRSFTFPDQAAADKFRQEAGIK